MKKFLLPFLVLALIVPLLVTNSVGAQTSGSSYQAQQLQAKLNQLLQIIRSLQAQLQALRVQRVGGVSFVSSPTASTTLPSSVAGTNTSSLANYEAIRGALASYGPAQNVVTQIEKLGMPRSEFVGEFPTLGSFVSVVNKFGGTADVATFLERIYNLGARWSDIKSDYGGMEEFLTKMNQSFSRNDLPYVNKILLEIKDLGATWSDIKTDDGLGGLKELFDKLSDQEDLQAMADLLATLDSLGADMDDLVEDFDNLGDTFDTMNNYGNGSWGGGNRSGSGSGFGSGSGLGQRSPLDDWSSLFGSRSGKGLPPGMSLGGLMNNSTARQSGPCGLGGCPATGMPIWDGATIPYGPQQMAQVQAQLQAGDPSVKNYVGVVKTVEKCTIEDSLGKRDGVYLELSKFTPTDLSLENVSKEDKTPEATGGAANVSYNFIYDPKVTTAPIAGSLSGQEGAGGTTKAVELKSDMFKVGSTTMVRYKQDEAQIKCKNTKNEEKMGHKIISIFFNGMSGLFKPAALSEDDDVVAPHDFEESNDI